MSGESESVSVFVSVPAFGTKLDSETAAAAAAVVRRWCLMVVRDQFTVRCQTTGTPFNVAIVDAIRWICRSSRTGRLGELNAKSRET